MNITATTRNVRMSPKKVREVTRQIAGLPVSKAPVSYTHLTLPTKA